jgi:hypothetical protein
MADDHPTPPSMEDRALKFIEAHNKAIWLAIAALAVVVVVLKRA